MRGDPLGADKPEPLAGPMASARRIDKLPLPCRSARDSSSIACCSPPARSRYAAGEGCALGVSIGRSDFGMPMGPIELSDVVGSM